MILHAPTLDVRDGMVRVGADVVTSLHGPMLPDRLWFEFEGGANDVTARSDAFAAVLLFPAMALGETLEIRGPVSPRLLDGLRRRAEILGAWEPKRFRTIEIIAEQRVPAPPARGEVWTTFSGGVDAFHTLWRYTAAGGAPPDGVASAATFLHGFDIPLADRETFDRAAAAYEEALGSLGVRLVRARTNAKHFHPAAPWAYLHGAVLGAAALAFSGVVSRFIVPSTDNPRAVPWGTHPALDPLLATEAMEVVLDGTELDRAEKVAVIAHWPLVQSFLRVCLDRPRPFANCCRCEKCVRTMVLLELEGVLDRCRTFPKRFRGRHIRRARFDRNALEGPDVLRMLMRRAWAVRRFDVLFDLAFAMARMRVRGERRGRRALPPLGSAPADSAASGRIPHPRGRP